jgi:hypothetical protein
VGSYSKVLKAKKAVTPGKGFNVVGVDRFEKPGDELFVVSHHPTRPEAEKALADWKRKNPGSKGHVFP